MIDGSSSRDMQIALLAGGMGKRLGIDAPKCLLKIGNSTLLDICVERLIKDGFREKDFIMLLGYKHEMVREHVMDGARYGIRMRYSVDPDNNIGWGKGKAFKHALLNHTIDSSKRTLVTFPDDILLEDGVYARFMQDHIEAVSRHGVYASIALVDKVEYPYGTAELDANNNITRFVEKPMLNIPTSIGLYAFEPEVYTIIDEHVDMSSPKAIELESVIFPILAGRGLLHGFLIDHRSWLPINTLKEYEKAIKALVNRIK
ncbi:MAG: sugar phosphate nucleotidyltransferase [Candidatus Nitrosocaldus sp.]|nr:sugar phosphate nucleotidyltransferase [Candidatus Nitrosocaldus sp.]MDW8275081.1 sugar phosphate nucleotidyltransferase [Candidatus Nitrosocaldus sp.]